MENVHRHVMVVNTQRLDKYHAVQKIQRMSRAQSTSTPAFFRSALARSISPMSSLCAVGTSLKVKTPQPSLKRR